jgi:hypothetical protein
MIRHRCPACNAVLASSPDLAGLEIHCPHCRGPIDVPGTTAAGLEYRSSPEAPLPAPARPRVPMSGGARFMTVLGGMLLQLVGLCLLALNMYFVVSCVFSRSWQSTEGKVTSSGAAVERGRTSRGRTMTTNVAHVEYTYQVAEKEYAGNTVDFGPGQRFRAAAQAVAGRYPSGKVVTVYYDPTSPRDSVLERDLTFGTYVWLVMSIAATYVGTRLILKGLMPQARVMAARRALWAGGPIVWDYVAGVPGAIALLVFVLLGFGL